jgi:hypothetical protein
MPVTMLIAKLIRKQRAEAAGQALPALLAPLVGQNGHQQRQPDGERGEEEVIGDRHPELSARTQRLDGDLVLPSLGFPRAAAYPSSG